MRIHSVEVAGFGPFREPQRVDFEAFAEHGIFLVQGRTGAGKSSILDAVVYALYNGAPRYGSRAADHLRSHHCGPEDPTWVEVELTVDSRRYRVRRSPEYQRPKARGEGLTPERATAQLWRLDGEDWVALEASVRTVGQALEQVLPLSQTQFLQVIMLAQGQFERFLVAESAERKKLLGTLFDSSRFDDFDTVLQERVGAARASLERTSSAVGAVLGSVADHLDVECPEEPDAAWLDGVTAVAQQESQSAERARGAAQERLTQERVSHDALRDLQSRQRRRAELEARHEVLSDQRASVEGERQRLARALAARSVRPGREAHARAAARAEELVAASGKAAVRYEETFGVPVPADAARQRDALVASVTVVQRSVEAEERLLRTAREMQECEDAVTATQVELAEVEASSERLRLVVAEPVEPSPEEAGRTVHALMDEVARATRHQEAVTQRRRAEVGALEAGERRTRASALLDDLRRRSMEQYAGRLAETLVDGEPCQVCGSTVHPAPATRGDEPVHEDDVEAAGQAVEAAQSACVRAEAELAAARASEAAHASALDLDEARALLTDATQRHQRAMDAQRAREDAARSLEELARRRQALEVARAGLRARQEALSTTAAALAHAVEEARGDANSVADRLAELREELRVVGELLATAEAAAQAVQERDTAARRLAEDLDLHGFSSAEAAAAAELDPETVARLESEVRAHDDAWTVVTSGLADPELRQLPPDPVELGEAEARLAAAAAAYEEAAASAGVARQRWETADRLRAQVHALWARDADERRDFDVLRRLAASVHGDPPNVRRMRLESYVLSVELEQIVLAANRRLAVMSTGRYELHLTDRVATRGNNAGLEVRVLDQHTQESRSPESLSGGEKFLASLSLALGLAEVVSERAGGVTLDTLFIDEGFGSLDAETLDLAMHSLDQLREHGRVVGVISHVEAMKERIPAQVVVEPTAGGWSSVRTVV